MNHEESSEFYQHLLNLIEPILPGYKKEGKSSLDNCCYCPGGQHRSVAFAQRLADDLAKIGLSTVAIVTKTAERKR